MLVNEIENPPPPHKSWKKIKYLSNAAQFVFCLKENLNSSLEKQLFQFQRNTYHTFKVFEII